MSLDKIDQYIMELQAIKDYDNVREEKADALKKVEMLENQLSAEKDKVQTLSNEVEELRRKQREKEEETKSSRQTLKVKDDETRKIIQEANDFKKRIAELEGLEAMVEGKTLSDAETSFLKAKEEEVSRKADALFQKMKLDWQRSSKLGEVRNDAIRLLKLIIGSIGKAKRVLVQKEVTDSGIYRDVVEFLNSEVQRRIDDEFKRRVESASEYKANEKLEALKSVEWPAWYKMNVEPKIGELESMIRTQILDLMVGIWNIRCDKCGTEQSMQLSPFGIEKLLSEGKILFECFEPGCKDMFGRHCIMVQLRSLIQAKLAANQSWQH